MPRFYLEQPLHAGAELALPPGPSRHAQVLRLQPGSAITLFNGQGGEWAAHISRMGRAQVHVQVLAHTAVEREAARPVSLGVGLMAAERMDWLIEKATELGAAAVQPVLTERATLRLLPERAAKKRAHWQAVAQAACEQSGRNRVPEVHPAQPLAEHLRHSIGVRWLLSLNPQAPSLRQTAAALAPDAPVHLLSGPEGGLSPAEEAAACAAGFAPVHLGPRVLRAETAPLAALAVLLAA